MTFISYAQNFEDLMLWRALKHIDRGFYIDVGAAWPDMDSVTKAFYERNWRGVNIEPNPEFHRQLEESRSRDKNLQVALGEHEDTLVINILNSTGLSTFDDDFAAKHQKLTQNLNRQEVHVTTLAKVWEQYVPAGQEVHFLKVDVEGFEEAVLRGNDWAKYRPWIVVVEATLPMSQIESYEDWEPFLLEAGYHFSYADGLNRFYVGYEHVDLLPMFKYPPNVFDGCLSSDQHDLQIKAIQTELALNQALAELQGVYNSFSWRITVPMRWVASVVRKYCMPASLGLHAKRGLEYVAALFCRFFSKVSGYLTLTVFKSQIKYAIRYIGLLIQRLPYIRRPIVFFLKRFPNIKNRLLQIMYGAEVLPSTSKLPIALAHLTPRAFDIYSELKLTIDRQRKESI